MPMPGIPLRKGVHRAVFRTLVQVLQSDPQLASYVKTWRTWTGDVDDANDPSIFELPWVRLSPIGDPEYMANVGQHAAPFTVKIETLQDGTRIDDPMDLYQAIVDCLFPGDRSVLTKLNNAHSTGKGAFKYSLKQPNFGQVELADGVATGGTALLQIGILLDTPT
jgi:hypothetical protein